jgi:hypothetical protein
MIRIEYLELNGQPFTKTYSTDGFKIRKIGTDEIYDEAIDVENAPFVYEETTEKTEEYKVDAYG